MLLHLKVELEELLHRYTINLRYLHFDQDGIEFNHNGDAVIYVWPWRRHLFRDKKWVSITFMLEGYDTLEELDQAWDDFNQAFHHRHTYDHRDRTGQFMVCSGCGRMLPFSIFDVEENPYID